MSFYSTLLYYTVDEGKKKQFLAGATVYGQFSCSPCVCMGLLQYSSFPPDPKDVHMRLADVSQ